MDRRPLSRHQPSSAQQRELKRESGQPAHHIRSVHMKLDALTWLPAERIPEIASRSEPPWLRAAVRERKENRNGETAKGETAMSIRYGVFVSTAVLTFELASTVFLPRTDSALEPTIPGRGTGTNHVTLFSREET